MAVCVLMPSGYLLSQINYQLQHRIQGGGGPWIGPTSANGTEADIFITGVEQGETYEIRVRAETGTVPGAFSAWSDIVAHTVIGESNPPPDVDTFLVTREADGTRVFTWTQAAIPIDQVGWIIKFKLGTGHAWADLAPLHTQIISASPYETNQLAAGTYTAGIAAIDRAGNISETPLIIESTIGNPRLKGALVQLAFDRLGWPGTLTDCWIDEMNELIATGTKDWSDFATDAVTWAGWTTWNRVPSDPIIYEHSAIDLDAVLTFTPLITVTGTGAATIFEKHSTDGISYSSYVDITGGASQITDRYIIIKISMANADPVISTVFFIADAETISEDLNDLDMSVLTGATGTLRLPIAKSYSVITSVQLALQAGAGGWTWDLVDRSVSLGPLINVFNPTPALADTIIDARVVGIASL
jgi:hypothetical protein